MRPEWMLQIIFASLNGDVSEYMHRQDVRTLNSSLCFEQWLRLYCAAAYPTITNIQVYIR